MSGASYNYVATASKPTAVSHSLVACFTGADTLNLIVSRCTRIEIYALEPQGLTLRALLQVVRTEQSIACSVFLEAS